MVLYGTIVGYSTFQLVAVIMEEEVVSLETSYSGMANKYI